MDKAQIELVKNVRKMSDQEAFNYLTNEFHKDDPVMVAKALFIIGHRPWRKECHSQLARHFLPIAHHNSIHFAIKSFLTFMNPNTLSKILWESCIGNEIKFRMAKYYFGYEIGRRFNNDHPSLTRWKCVSSD